MATCLVESSWMTKNDRSISEAVVCTMEGEDPDKGGTLEGGISLHHPDTDTEDTAPCNLNLHHPTHRISAVDILCDAKRGELFSHQGAYMSTIRGIRVDGDLGLDTPLYMIQHSFDEPTEKCSVRLVSLTNPRQLWVHSIYITTVTRTASMATNYMAPAIDLDKVKVMLDDMGQDIPDNARHLLSSVEMFQKSKQSALGAVMGTTACPPGSTAAPQVAALMSMFSSMQMAHEPSVMENVFSERIKSPDISASFTKIPEQTPEQITRTEAVPEPDSTILDTNETVKCTKCGCTCDRKSGEMRTNMSSDKLGGDSSGFLFDVEQRFQKSIQQAEQRIMENLSNQVTTVENRIQDKLDLILRKIETNGLPKKLSEHSLELD